MKAHRRRQNEGSIFRRQGGRWCAILSFGRENGKRKRKSFYGASAAEVQEQLLKARMDLVRGLPVAVERQTVAQFLADWLENTIKPTVRISTYVSYEHEVRNQRLETIWCQNWVTWHCANSGRNMSGP